MTVLFKGTLFTNKNLEIGDEVYPIYTPALRNFCFLDYMCGFPDEPHTILDLKRSNYKPYETHTSHGYGPEESYFKIIPTGSVEPDIIIPDGVMDYVIEGIKT